MERLKFIVLILLMYTSNLYSQFYGENDWTYHIGVGIGAMNSITDIGGAHKERALYPNQMQLKNSHFSPSIYGGIMYRDFLGIKLQATLGKVEGADSTINGKTNNLISKNIRNLSFRSKIAELALLAELHPLTAINLEIFPHLSPYLIGGVGYFAFNPQAQYNGQWIDLQPLHLEGQGFEEYPDRPVYNLSGFNIPFGAGVRYDLSDVLNVKLEFLHRMLFTDFLDDASNKVYINPSLFSKYLSPSQAALARVLYNRTKDGSIPVFRGHANEKDAYMSLSLKVGITLGRNNTGGRSSTRHLKCFF